MICSACGTENSAGRRFCLECGAALAVACPACGAANEPQAKFCGACAARLTVEVPASAAASAPGPGPATSLPHAERRVVSTLFADLEGFTAFAEGRDTEEVRERLSSYYEAAADVIHRYGGTVEKFIGDAVMAVWGAPSAHEDDAERAVRAALELVGDGVAPEGVRIRAAVASGEAAVTLGATDQGLVAGDLVNTASRLQSVAPAGTVLVDEATQRAAARAIAFEPAGEQALKGKAAPVAAWRALRVVAQVGGRNRSDTLEAPFVGRDDELRLLKDLFHATAREGRARLVSVIGPAGIGKSRLAWELLKYLDGLVEPIWWHAGRCPAYGDGIAFWALGEVVRERAGLSETDDQPTTRLRIAATVAEHVADEAERRWIEAALLTLLGIESGAPTDQLFAAWRTFFERLAATAPVVIAFEDFQFADTGLMAFVDHLLEWARNVPIYVVTLARPELIERRPEWGAGKRNFTSLYLEPLPPAAMRELLAGLVPGLGEATVAGIVERADGVPLYAVEIVRMLLAEGRLEAHAAGHRPVGDLATLEVPHTLVALISSRLDALPADQHSLVGDAAVLGQSFAPAALAAIAGRDVAELATPLAELVRREILRLEADPRSPERGQYVFVQALIREVAYRTLARADRKSRHLAAARYFEASGDDELAGILAGHYGAALADTPAGPEADALATQARLTLRGAAERAAALGSPGQALDYLEQALALVADPLERALLEERAGIAADRALRLEAAETHLEAARRGHEATGDSTGVVRVAASQGRVLIAQDRTAEAVVTLESARPADPAKGGGSTAVLLAELARAYAYVRDPRALATADEALRLAEAGRVPEAIAEAIINRALVLGWDDRVEEPQALLRGILPYTERHGLSSATLRTLNNLSAGEFFEDPRTGIARGRRGIDLATRVGDQRWLLVFLGALAGSLTIVGELDEALALMARIQGLDLPPGAARTAASTASFLLAVRGDDQGARARLAAAPPPSSDDHGQQEATEISLARAQVDILAGRLMPAYHTALEGAALKTTWRFPNAVFATRAGLWMADPARAQHGLSILDELGLQGRFVEALGGILHAGVLALQGDPDRSLATYRVALRDLHELDMPLHEAFGQMELGTLLDPSLPEVAAARTEARRLIERMGAPALLARLEALEASQADRFSASSGVSARS